METSKIQKGKSKTTCFFLFYLKFVKMKMFLQFWPSNNHTYHSVLAVYKYSRRLLTRALSAKVVSNNLSLWLSYDRLLSLSLSLSNLIFSNLILPNFLLVSKRVFSSLRYFKVSFSEFNAPTWKCANEFASISDT